MCDARRATGGRRRRAPDFSPVAPLHPAMDVANAVAIALASTLALGFALSALWAPRAFPLAGRVVAITGGSSGIGKAVAAEALLRGARVATSRAAPRCSPRRAPSCSRSATRRARSRRTPST